MLQWPTGKFFPGAHEWGQSVQKRLVLVCEDSLCPRKQPDVSGPDLGEAGRYMYKYTWRNPQHPTPQTIGIYKNRKYPHHCAPAYSTDATVGCKNKEIDLSFTSKISWIDHDPSLQIGRAHVWTPVTHTYLVCRLLLEKKNNSKRWGENKSGCCWL